MNIPQFRVWDKSKYRMIQGDLLNISFGGNNFGVYYLEESELCLGNEEDFILMMWTGLTDQNNTRIYDGDIIEFIEFNFEHGMEVEYERKGVVSVDFGCDGVCTSFTILGEKMEIPLTFITEIASDTILVIGNTMKEKPLNV